MQFASCCKSNFYCIYDTKPMWKIPNDDAKPVDDFHWMELQKNSVAWKTFTRNIACDIGLSAPCCFLQVKGYWLSVQNISSYPGPSVQIYQDRPLKLNISQTQAVRLSTSERRPTQLSPTMDQAYRAGGSQAWCVITAQPGQWSLNQQNTKVDEWMCFHRRPCFGWRRADVTRLRASLISCDGGLHGAADISVVTDIAWPCLEMEALKR